MASLPFPKFDPLAIKRQNEKVTWLIALALPLELRVHTVRKSCVPRIGCFMDLLMLRYFSTELLLLPEIPTFSSAQAFFLPRLEKSQIGLSGTKSRFGSFKIGIEAEIGLGVCYMHSMQYHAMQCRTPAFFNNEGTYSSIYRRYARCAV